MYEELLEAIGSAYSLGATWVVDVGVFSGVNINLMIFKMEHNISVICWSTVYWCDLLLQGNTFILIYNTNHFLCVTIL